MKAFSIATVLTGVTILLCSSLSLGAEAKSPYKTHDQCLAKYQPPSGCSTEEELAPYGTTVITDKTTTPAGRGTKIEECKKVKREEYCASLGLPGKEDVKDCAAAFDKYNEEAKKEKTACDSFDKSGGKSCKAKVEKCEKTISGITDPGSFTSDSGGYEFLDDAIEAYSLIDRYKNPTATQQTSSIAAAGGVCVKSIDREARAKDKKEKTTERQRLSDKIEQQKKDITTAGEEINKKRAENKKSVNTIEKDAKTASLERQKSTNEKVSESNKQLLAIESSINKRKQDIAEKMRTLAQVNFEFQSQMLDLTDDEIKNTCKQEFEAYKAALLSGGNIAGASEQDRAKVAALADQYKKKGILGSGEMKRLLITTRKKCYTQMNQKKRRSQLTNAQAVQKIQEGIQEEKKQMLKDKDLIATTQKELATAQKQLEDEGKAADAAKAAELDALSQELQADIENTDLKTRIAQEKIQELTAEINNLVLVENFEVEDAYSEATEAITAGINARTAAQEICDCEANPKTVICSQLAADQATYDGKKVKGKTRTGN